MRQTDRQQARSWPGGGVQTPPPVRLDVTREISANPVRNVLGGDWWVI